MQIRPPPHIALTCHSGQLIKTTTRCREIAALDLQPCCLNNPFSLQNTVTALLDVGLSFPQDRLSLLETSLGRLKSGATQPQLKRLTREWRQISDANLGLAGT
jgi:hypothetical protein